MAPKPLSRWSLTLVAVMLLVPPLLTGCAAHDSSSMSSDGVGSDRASMRRDARQSDGDADAAARSAAPAANAPAGAAGVGAADGEADEGSVDTLAIAPSAADDAARSVAQSPADARGRSAPRLAPRPARPSPHEMPRRSHPPRDMRFEDAGVNAWHETERDSLSTFAVDVDTGSYPIVRRYLADDVLPPVAAVRPEEVLNYFGAAYDYDPPLLGTFAVHVDGAPSPYGRREHVLRVGVKGREVRERRRDPLSLTLVIDVSGSMEEGGRLELVKEGLRGLVDRLGDGDDLAIVSYSTNARVVLRRTAMGDEEGRWAAQDAIDGLRPSNSTNAEAGLTLGYDLADAGWREGAVNKVVLASDGVANVGATGPGSILARIGDYVRRDITLTAIGVGMGTYNDALLEQLADRGDGSYHYIDDHAEMRRVLVDGLVETLVPIALDAKVQVEFDPGNVIAWRLVGYENRDVADRDFENDDVDAGEIGAGRSVTALYALELDPEPEGRLGAVRVRWEEPDGGEVEEIEERFGVGAIAEGFDEAAPGLRLAAAAAGFADLLRDGHWARTARYEEVADIAFEVAMERERGARLDEVAELARLAEQAGWLAEGLGYGGRYDEGPRDRGVVPLARAGSPRPRAPRAWPLAEPAVP